MKQVRKTGWIGKGQDIRKLLFLSGDFHTIELEAFTIDSRKPLKSDYAWPHEDWPPRHVEIIVREIP